jgi:FKBP-type peptidyl-prolyl cis-trans isomerase
MRTHRFPIALGLVCSLFLGCQEGTSSTPQAPSAPAANAAEAAPADADLATDDQKTIYAMGYELSKMIAPYNLSDTDLPAFQKGLADGVKKAEPAINVEEFGGPKVAELAKARAAGLAEVQKKEALPFLDKAAAEAGAKKTESGLIYVELTPGTGPQPTASDQVKVHYTGKLIDGTVFDSSVERGQPATFPLAGVIPCWTEGLQLMKQGGKGKLVCPPDIAYGDAQKGPLIKPGSTLVFEVELLEILPSEAAEAPEAAPQ